MDIDERIMDKVLADVKEIIVEPDGLIRFIFYTPYTEEVEEDTDGKIKDLRDVILAKERYIDKLTSDIERLKGINASNITEIKELKYKIISKEEYITELMSENNNKTTSIALLEQKLAGDKND